MTEEELAQFKEHITCSAIDLVFDAEYWNGLNVLHQARTRKAVVSALTSAAATFALTDEEWAERMG